MSPEACPLAPAAGRASGAQRSLFAWLRRRRGPAAPTGMVRSSGWPLAVWLAWCACLLPSWPAAADVLVRAMPPNPHVGAADCHDAAPGSGARRSVRLEAPVGGWSGAPLAVLVGGALWGEVVIRHADVTVCGTPWDARTLDTRFRTGVGTVVVPQAGSSRPVEVELATDLPPLLPAVIQHGSPAAVQRQDGIRFAVRIACFAVIIALALAALLSFLGLREPVFLAFAVSVTGFGLWQAMLSGLWGFPEPWMPLAGLGPNLLVGLPLAITGGVARLLAKQAGIDRRFPGIDRPVRAFMWGMLALGTTALLLPGAALRSAAIAAEAVFAVVCVGAGIVFAGQLVRGRVRGGQALLTLLPFLVFGFAQLISPATILPWKIELFMLSGAWFVLVSSLFLTERMLRLRRKRDELRAQADSDPLTGLSNRRALVRRLNPLVRVAQDAGQPLAVAFIDIDGFKSLNERLGHAGGDRVLVAVASVIRHVLRVGDQVARMGGDEFLVVLPGTELEPARRVLAGLPARLRAVGAGLGQPDLQVTASIGLASLGVPPDGIADLLGRADAALYTAKRKGRDRIEVALPAAAPTWRMPRAPAMADEREEA